MTWYISSEGVGRCVFEPWIRAGIRHEMLGAPLDFRKGFRAESLSAAEWLLGESIQSPVRWLNQTHSTHLFGVGLPADVGLPPFSENSEGDGFVFSLSASDGVFAITTADCLAVAIISGQWGALVHAGWRGLAAGILKKAAANVHRLSASPLSFVIAPHASALRYEVGREVIEAFGDNQCIASPTKACPTNDRFFLNLAATARAQIESALIPISGWHNPDLCTIHLTSWHSYRRDREDSGRNVTMIMGGVDHEKLSTRFS